MGARPSDNVWGLVCGFAEPTRSNRLLLMLQAYVDDSNMGQGNVSVLAGWVARAEVWARFSDDWKAALDAPPHIDYFKWAELRNHRGQFAMGKEFAGYKLNMLIDVIATHKPFGFTSAMPNNLYKEVFGGIGDPAIEHPYFLSFFGIIAQLVEFLAKQDTDEKVDFIFDTQPGQMAKVLASWEAFLSIAPPEARKIMGDPPIFRDDKKVMPLQAADLIAGFKREQYNDTFFERESPPPPWGDRASNIQALERYWDREMMMNVRERALPTVRGSGA